MCAEAACLATLSAHHCGWAEIVETRTRPPRSDNPAPLSSGLDIARKPLGQHEIATTSPC
jgi:hypothetical protein